MAKNSKIDGIKYIKIKKIDIKKQLIKVVLFLLFGKFTKSTPNSKNYYNESHSLSSLTHSNIVL